MEDGIRMRRGGEGRVASKIGENGILGTTPTEAQQSIMRVRWITKEDIMAYGICRHPDNTRLRDGPGGVNLVHGLQGVVE
eukprot:evm.model.NODE_36041_length_4550_cov_15.978242.1